MDDDLSDSDEILEHSFGSNVPNVDLSRYKFSKRQPLRGYTNENDTFVSASANKLVLTKKLRARLAKPKNSITLHALGRAASVAVDVAQFLCNESNGELALSVRTSTETLIDDYDLIREPIANHSNTEIEKDMPEHIAQFRHVSAIHITLTTRSKKSKKALHKTNVSLL
jgi:DNA-binding protein